MRPALLLLELDSVAAGIRAGDAMAKRAPITTLHAGTVQPGKYLVLAGGEVGAVEEAHAAGRLAGGDALVDQIFLPEVHEEVVAALIGARRPTHGEALGVIETRTVAATIGAADAGVKGGAVVVLGIRIADGLGGKGYVLFGGAVSDVEAAVAHGVASLDDPALLVGRVVIPSLHAEMAENLSLHPEFRRRLRPE